ncbi:MAG: double zinc ribbon domain-containing protein [Phycisphaerae bacterium]
MAASLSSLTASASDGAGALLWPARCLACGEFVESGMPLCASCFEGLKSACGEGYCSRCGTSHPAEERFEIGCGTCANLKLHFDGFCRAGRYESTLRKLVLGAKHSENTALRELLALIARVAFEERLACEMIDVVVPVPLHWTRRLGRGFNQAQIVAEAISGDVPMRIALKRTRRTKPQPVLASFAARARNVRGAFGLRKGIDLRGLNICIVDDVRTSGATLNECARVLKDAGAARVFAFALATAGTN